MIQTIYLLASMAAVIAMLPQVKQLIITKQSDELNLATWITWATYQAIALMYSLTLGALPYILANIAWVMFYIVMIALIIKFRPKPYKLAIEHQTKVD